MATNSFRSYIDDKKYKKKENSCMCLLKRCTSYCSLKSDNSDKITCKADSMETVQKCKNLADGFLMYIRKTEGKKGEDVFTNEACFQLYLDIGYLARKPASGRHESQEYPVGPGNRYSMSTNQDDFWMKENEIKDGLNVEYWTTHPLRLSFQLGEGMDRDSRKDLRDAINGFHAMLNGDVEKMDIECVKKAWRTCERHLNEVLKPFEYLPQQTNDYNCCNIS